MDNYQNKNIWIIGASSGIGSALAQELSKQGANLIVSARREEQLLEVLKSCEGKEHMPLALDVADYAAVASDFEKIKSHYGDLDSVIFLAAIYSPHSEEPKEISFIHQMINVNIGGVYNMLDVVLPHYKEKGAGQVAICASVAGYRGLPTGQPYCSTKAALINLCESLRVELKPKNIDVKVINPGFVKTPLTDKNDFPMPMMIEAEKAAQYIARDLIKNKFEIHFPKRFTFFMKILKVLPNPLYFLVASKLR